MICHTWAGGGASINKHELRFCSKSNACYSGKVMTGGGKNGMSDRNHDKQDLNSTPAKGQIHLPAVG